MASLDKAAAARSRGSGGLNKAGDAGHDPADSGPVVAETPPRKQAAPRKAAAGKEQPAKAAKTEAAPAAKRTATKRVPSRPAGEQAEAKPVEAEAKSAETTVPTVLTPPIKEAERVGLYLHPSDYRALQLAKVDDRADANARIRAMIAVWRANPRFRNTVDRLARTAPRGPYSGRS